MRKARLDRRSDFWLDGALCWSINLWPSTCELIDHKSFRHLASLAAVCETSCRCSRTIFEVQWPLHFCLILMEMSTLKSLNIKKSPGEFPNQVILIHHLKFGKVRFKLNWSFGILFEWRWQWIQDKWHWTPKCNCLRKFKKLVKKITSECTLKLDMYLN